MNSRRNFIQKSFNSVISFFLFTACKPKRLIPTNLAIGKLADLKEGANNLDFYRVVVNKKIENGKIVLNAMSKLCTHQSCMVKNYNQNFICPCHGSIFSERGEVLKGPALTNLPYFHLSIDPLDQLTIDFNQIVSSDWKLELSVR